MMDLNLTRPIINVNGVNTPLNAEIYLFFKKYMLFLRNILKHEKANRLKINGCKKGNLTLMDKFQ